MAAPGHIRPVHDTRVVAYLTPDDAQKLDHLVVTRDAPRSAVVRELLREALASSQAPEVAA